MGFPVATRRRSDPDACRKILSSGVRVTKSPTQMSFGFGTQSYFERLRDKGRLRKRLRVIDPLHLGSRDKLFPKKKFILWAIP